MRYIPVVRCEFCPYKRPHNLIVGQYKCVAMEKEYDNNITHCIVGDGISTDCPLPTGCLVEAEAIKEDNNAKD